MNILTHRRNDTTIAEIISDEVIVLRPRDILDLMADCREREADTMILRAQSLHSDFFDLKTGFAGEVLQKFSNYQMRLAIVGDFSNITSNALRDFIYESNKHRRIVFVSNVDEARILLAP